MLAAAVDPGKGFFVQQTEEAVLFRRVAKNIHDQHVVVGGDVGFLVQRSQFELAGSHFVVPGLRRDAQGVEAEFHVLHEGHDPRRH